MMIKGDNIQFLIHISSLFYLFRIKFVSFYHAVLHPRYLFFRVYRSCSNSLAAIDFGYELAFRIGIIG